MGANNFQRDLLALLFTGLLAACGDDSANPTPTATFTTSSNGGSTNEGAGGNGGNGNGGNGAGEQGGDGGSGGSCEGEDGCYSCEPVENEHFLNACTDADCVPFDNVARLPLYNGGDLPPVP